MGLDLGSKTLGVSISDKTGTIANMYDILRFEEDNYDSLYERLKEIVLKEQVSKIILGLPKNMNNTIGSRADIALSFGSKLSKYLNIEVVMQDERRTSIEANNYLIEANMSRKKRKKKIDGIAANIILQTYLDTRKEDNNDK